MFKDINMETPRLLIRAFTMSDLQPIHGILSQLEVMTYVPEGAMSPEEVRDTLAWIINCYDKNTPRQIIKFTVAVTEKATSRLIGWVGLGPLPYSPGVPTGPWE
jgi:ribosomal-protein-alanine N-acetyltransferase